MRTWIWRLDGMKRRFQLIPMVIPEPRESSSNPKSDVDSLEDGAVTVRDRDSMTQERVPVEGVKRLIVDRLAAARA